MIARAVRVSGSENGRGPEYSQPTTSTLRAAAGWPDALTVFGRPPALRPARTPATSGAVAIGRSSR